MIWWWYDYTEIGQKFCRYDDRTALYRRYSQLHHDIDLQTMVKRQVRDFILQMLCIDPSQRLTARKVSTSCRSERVPLEIQRIQHDQHDQHDQHMKLWWMWAVKRITKTLTFPQVKEPTSHHKPHSRHREMTTWNEMNGKTGERKHRHVQRHVTFVSLSMVQGFGA